MVLGDQELKKLVVEWRRERERWIVEEGVVLQDIQVLEEGTACQRWTESC